LAYRAGNLVAPGAGGDLSLYLRHVSAHDNRFVAVTLGTRPAPPVPAGVPLPTTTARRGLVVAVVMMGVLMAAVDTTIVVLALPAMERSLHIAVSAVIWVVIAYILVVTIMATQVGRLGDMFGRARMYQLGFLVFVVGSALCASAGDETGIVVFRCIQGLGGAFLTANSGAVLADAFPPEERGRAFGYNSIGWNVGAILGILLGGLIITYTSWRWIFWINVPTGLLALGLALSILKDPATRERHHVDLTGMALLGAGLFGVLWAMTHLATSSFSGPVVGYLAGGALLLAVFGLVEHRSRAPMVDLSIFRIPTLAPTMLAALFQALSNFAVLYLVLMYLQGVRGLTPLHASLLLVPGYLVGGVIGPFCGRLADRVGVVWPATAGLMVQIGALAVYAQLQPRTSLWLVSAAAVLNGIGAGAFMPANNSAVMKVAPGADFGAASGLLRTFSNVGMVFSFAVAILVAARSISRHLAFAIFLGTSSLPASLGPAFTSGLHAAFYSSIGFMALAAVLSATRVLGTHRHPRTPTAPAIPVPCDCPDQLRKEVT
jgi:EmrB/QacA subfamily drug resistance transporter